jgi:hypothetical protein
LEAQVKELENSNRILRMKVVGSDDAVQHIKVNTNENMHTVPHCGPKRDENLHYTHQWQQNSDIQYPNNPLNDMNHLTNTAEVGLLKERISHLEETRLLYRRINDLEVNVIHQKINNLERTVNNMNHNSQNIRYQAPVTQSFLPQPVQTVYQQGQNYYPQAYSYPHMATYIRPPPPAYYRPPIYPTHPAASYANFGHGHIVQGVRPNLNNNVIGQWSPINPQQGATVSQNNQQHRARVELHKLEPTGMNHTREDKTPEMQGVNCNKIEDKASSNLTHAYPRNTNTQEMARCGVTDINNDQLCKKPKCQEEKGKINVHLEQDKLTGVTNAKLGHEIVNIQDTNILDFNKLRGERENEDREQQLPDSNGAAEKNTKSYFLDQASHLMEKG